MESWNVNIDKTNSKTSTKYTHEVENCDPVCLDIMKQYQNQYNLIGTKISAYNRTGRIMSSIDIFDKTFDKLHWWCSNLLADRFVDN